MAEVVLSIRAYVSHVSGTVASHRPQSLGDVFRSLLDLVIVFYASGLALIALFGGGDLGVVSFHQAEKPVLALLLLVPLRAAVGGPSWLGASTQTTLHRLKSSWTALSARLPPAVSDTLVAVITVRAATVVAAFLANLIFEPATARGFSMPFSNIKFVEVFAAWDSGWYWDIAMRGYYFRDDAQSSIAFFPLYPILMRFAAAPFGGSASATWVAGIVVAFAANLAALIEIHRFAERIFGRREIARRTVLYIMVFPWSFFLGSVYTESVFLLTSVLALSRAYDGRWTQAGVWGALATLTRPNGVLIAVPLAVLACRERPSIRQVVRRGVALAPIPIALAGFCAYVFLLTGSPFGWMSAQAHWGYSLGHPPWQQLQRVTATFIENGPYEYFFTTDIAAFELLQAATALMFLALTPLIFRRLGAAMGTYVLVSLLIPLSSNTLEGLGRYSLVLFPAFFLVAAGVTARMHEVVVIVSLVFRTLLVCLFVTWQPIY
jgi:mannosyltransferase PIG-V